MNIWIGNHHAKNIKNIAVFTPSPSNNNSPSSSRKSNPWANPRNPLAVAIIDDLNITVQNRDTQGDIYEYLQIGGKCGVIVPDCMLFGTSNAHKKLRQLLLEECQLEAVISIPSGVFKPYAGVSTAALVFIKVIRPIRSGSTIWRLTVITGW